tara:strand:+ start:144 stop:1868 length:1725 start_codon:yes stop_codon:yes gene_type:complete
MMTLKKVWALFFLFIFEEIKILRNRIIYLKVFYSEVKILKFLLKGITRKNDIFKIENQNKYLKLISKKLGSKNMRYKTDKRIFVESFINHPAYVIPNCFIAKIIQDQTKYELHGILRSGDIKAKKLMNSFGIKKIIYINEGNFFSRIYYLYLSFVKLNKIKNIKDLLNFKINNIDFGQAVYEQFIRFKKNPDIPNIDINFYYLMSKVLYLDANFNKIFKNFKHSYLVQSETQYLPFRISLQNALKFNIKVFSKRGISKNGIRVYKKFKERNENRNKISRDLFDKYYFKYMSKNKNKVNKFYNHQNRSFFGKDTYQQIFKNKQKNKIISTKLELCEHLKLNFDKPIVIILSHELTDGNLNNSWNLFENDMYWLKETMKKIVSLNSVNWIIKSHPSEDIYNAKIKTKLLYEKYCKDKKNIKLFPKNLKLQNENKIYNCAITSHGSAGFEFPGIGIPTIICGDTPYSSLGFNVEPKSKKEYFELLRNIKKIKKNSKLEIQKCRFFNFMYHQLCTIKNPIMHEADITMNYDRNKIWNNLLKNLNNYEKFNTNYVDSVKNLIISNSNVLINLKNKSSLK